MSLTTALSAAARAVRRGRIAPATRRLFVDLVRLQTGRWTSHLLAFCQPVARTRRWWVRGSVAVVGRRRVVVETGSRSSIHDREVEAAAAWSAALRAHGTESRLSVSSAGPELHLAEEPQIADLEQVAAALGPAWSVEVLNGTDVSARRHDRFDEFSPVRVVEIPLVTSGPNRHEVDVHPGDVHPIDVVITWVDPSDASWRRSFDQFHAGATGTAAHTSRFENNDELVYAMRSIWMHCGWFRQIVLVTAGEIPPWIRPDDRVRIVHHDEFMPADALPTFNSHAIESRLHHIPGLAERFVYCNDDFFVGRPTTPSTFFGDDLETPQVFAVDAPLADDASTDPGQIAAARRTSTIVSERFARNDVRLLEHAPYSNMISITEAAEQAVGDDFRRTAHARFRSPDDLSVAASLAPWWSVATGSGHLADAHIEYVSLGHPTTRLKLRRVMLDPPTFWCANRTEHSAPGVHTLPLTQTLHSLYPEPAPWERP